MAAVRGDALLSAWARPIVLNQSLHEISGGLASLEGKLVHLGIRPPKRSTLAYANEHRPWQLYQSVFYQMLERCKALVATRQRTFRFKNKLLSLDATVIDLCAALKSTMPSSSAVSSS